MLDKNVRHRRCSRLCLLTSLCRVRRLICGKTDCYPGLYSILVYPGARRIPQLVRHHPIHKTGPCSKPASFAGWLFKLELIDREDPVSHHTSVSMLLCPLRKTKRYFVAIMQLAVHDCNMLKGRNPTTAPLLLPFRCTK